MEEIFEEITGGREGRWRGKGGGWMLQCPRKYRGNNAISKESNETKCKCLAYRICTATPITIIDNKYLLYPPPPPPPLFSFLHAPPFASDFYFDSSKCKKHPSLRTRDAKMKGKESKRKKSGRYIDERERKACR